METFKIKHFEADNPLSKFPWFRSLSDRETALIRNRLFEKLGCTSQDADCIVNVSDMKEVVISDFNAKDDKFKLSLVLDYIDVHPEENVCINWYRYDQIDEIKFADLNDYFGAIWYSGADDIDIFDSTLSWVLSISHEGYTKFVKFKE